MMFHTFGFLFNIILIPLEGYNFAYNLGFIGMQLTLLFQSINQLSFVCALVTFFGFEHKDLYNSEMFFLLITVTLRNVVIGVKYGYYSDEKVLLLN
jgi:uncharacterized RDD family membrane protein YckC